MVETASGRSAGQPAAAASPSTSQPIPASGARRSELPASHPNAAQPASSAQPSPAATFGSEPASSEREPASGWRLCWHVAIVNFKLTAVLEHGPSFAF